MSRKPRIFIEGYWYHICTRGQRKEPLFFSPDDRDKYLELLDKELLRAGASLGAFCIMRNHVHLLVRQGKVPLSKAYHKVHAGYAKYFNSKRGTVGHVFQGPPVCRIILNEKYLYTVMKYIHQNPVKANIVCSESEYRWSSAGASKERNRICQLHSYKVPELMNLEDVEGVDLNKNAGYLGKKDEWRALQKRFPGRGASIPYNRRKRRSMDKIAGDVCFGTGISIDDTKGPSREREISNLRHRAMALMIKEGYGYTEAALYFNRTYRIAVKAWNKFYEKNKS